MGGDDPRGGQIKGREARYVGDFVLLNHAVTEMNDIPAENPVRINDEFKTADGAVRKATDTVDDCISTMQPQCLAKVNTGLRQDLKDALLAADQTAATKVGWQARSRFWEEENSIYGGISWTSDPASQMWYPSDDFNARTGVITGAYNRGPAAELFGQLAPDGRLKAALRGGEKLHPGFTDKVLSDRGLSVAWQYMPFHVAGWANETAYDQPEVYKAITEPRLSRIYPADDTWSCLPGWQEGAVTAADEAISRMARTN